MFKKLKSKIQNLISNRELRDPRTYGMILLLIAALSVSWSSAKAIKQNHDLLKRASKISEENRLLELQNQNKKLQNQYYTTSQYAEVSARRLLGVAAPGETLYIVPKEVALSKVAPYQGAEPADASTQTPDQNPVQKPRYQQNFEDWISFFFGRGLSD